MSSAAPKTLVNLTSLATLSRVRSSGAGLYVIRSTRQEGCVVVRHRRAASNSVAAPTTSPQKQREPSSSSHALLRTSSKPGSTSNALPKCYFDSYDATSNAPGSSRSFSASAYQPHQQPIQSHSNSIHHPPIPSSPTSSSSSGGFESSSSKPSSSVPSHGTRQQSTLAQHADPSSSTSSTQPSTSQDGIEPSIGRATFFASDLAANFPSHALPSFFGATLNIGRRSNLVFRNGAYGIPKRAGVDTSRMSKGKGKENVTLAEHALSVSVGEDAYFLRSDSLGVADGVGGWSKREGSNPARWSLKLMHHCSAELARYEDVDDPLFLRYYDVDPVDVLQRAFEKSLAESKEEGVIGSSTALVAVLRNDELRLANMGDCCCSIIRGTECIFRSELQQHSFNYPVQAGTSSKDIPIKDAQRIRIKIQKDDIVILSSDGLHDNVFASDLLEEVLKFIAKPTSPPPEKVGFVAGLPGFGPKNPPATPSAKKSGGRQGSKFTLNFSPAALSEALCKRARSVYEDQHAFASPFQQKAMEEGIHFVGGKRDDVTTLVGVIGEMEAAPDRRWAE